MRQKLLHVGQMPFQHFLMDFPFQAVIIDSQFKGLANIGEIIVCAENQDFRLGMEFLYPAYQLQAVYHRHLDIRNQDIHRMLLQIGQGLTAVRYAASQFELHLIPVNHGTQHHPYNCFIISYQYCVHGPHPLLYSSSVVFVMTGRVSVTLV